MSAAGLLPLRILEPSSPSQPADLTQTSSSCITDRPSGAHCGGLLEKPLQPTRQLKHHFGTRGVGEEGGGFQNVRCGFSPRLYDCGTPYCITYSRNPLAEPDAIENILCGDDEPARKAAAESAFVTVFGKEWYAEGKGIVAGATYTLRTKQGRCTITISLPSPEPPVLIDSNLDAYPRVPLSQLVRSSSLASTVDMVYHSGGIYACKLTSSHIPYDDRLKDVKTALALRKSPYIIDVLALVTSGDHYRGFLMPYSPLGSLADSLQRRKYGWPQRSQFAHDIVLGVQALHSIEAFNGDLKPENIS